MKESEHSFCVIIYWPLKPGHVIVLPKRHVASLSDLKDYEAKDYFDLIDDMMGVIKSAYPEEDPIMLMNSGGHCTQKHLHIHLLPSKGGLRDLVSNYEDVPKREEKSKEEMGAMRDELVKYVE